MKRWLGLIFALVCQHALAQTPPPCSSNPTVGTLTLGCTVPTSSGIGPFLAFGDCTGSTDTALSASQSVTQDVYFQWSYGDGGASGTGTWQYGSNPGVNSMNTSTGIVGAHLYIVSTDTTFIIQVWAFDGTNVATCTMQVTAYDPGGSNGFSGTATKCVSSSGTPVAGSGGCPAGAAVLNTGSFATATASLTGSHRVLLKCGDTFTGTSTLITNSKNSLDVYGSCANVAITSGTTANYPSTGQVNIDTQATDVRVSNLYITGASPSVRDANAYIPPATLSSRITLWNLWSNSTNESYYLVQCTQCGHIQLVQVGMGANQGTFPNFGENNCAAGGATYPCSGGYIDIDYNAIMGGSYNGQGAGSSGGIETMRISACRKCVIADNTIENANSTGAVLKFHDGNTKNSSAEWIGQYAEYIEISDNLFTGSSGAQLVEICPQNANYDERLRYIVIERNVAAGATGSGVKGFAISGNNITARNNACGSGVGECISFAMRGSEWTSCTAANCAGNTTSSAPQDTSAPEHNEAYNNVCANGPSCVHFETWGNNGSFFGFNGYGNNSVAENNLYYKSGGSGSGNTNGGTGNTVSNNTTNGGLNPSFSNGSGTFLKITDYKPSANYSGASTSVQNFFDAAGLAWVGGYTLGAESQAAP